MRPVQRAQSKHQCNRNGDTATGQNGEVSYEWPESEPLASHLPPVPALGSDMLPELLRDCLGSISDSLWGARWSSRRFRPCVLPAPRLDGA